MSRRAWWGAGLAVLVLLPAGLVAAAVLTVDPNRFKPALEGAVLDATGRRLAIAGAMRFTPSLRPTIEADWVTLANLPGGTRPEMARAERISVVLSIPALLQRRIEVTQLTLTGPDILFEQVNGEPNWRFDLPAPAGPAPQAEPAGPAFSLRIRNALVQNGMVTWRLPNRTKVLGIRGMDVRHHSDGGPIEFDGTYVYSDNQPFHLAGSMLPTAGLAGPWNTRLDLTAFDTAASATGTMDTAGAYDMQLEASIGSLEALNALLPEMRLPAVHKLQLSARLGNGRQNGDLPVVGATTLSFADADMAGRIPGLKLGASTLSIDKPGGTATLKAAGSYAGQAFTLSGTTGVPLHPDDRLTLPIDLVLRAAPGRVGVTLGLKGGVALRTLAYEGLDATATLATPALAALRPLVTPALPALTDVAFTGRVVLPLGAPSVSLRAAKLTSRQGDLAGEGRLGLGAALDVTGTLQSEALDLDAMLEAFGIDPFAGGAAAGPHVIPDAPIAWGVLRGPRLDLAIGVDQLRFMQEGWRGVALGVQLKDGRLARGRLSLASAGGPLVMSMAADANQASVPVELVIEAPSLPLALVARTAGLAGPVSGTARVQARLQARGGTLHELAATLDGTASLATVGGRITNAAFVALTSASLAALGIRVPPQGETEIGCLGVAALFRGGVGTLNPIALETTHLSLAGEGQVDLRQERLALDLKPLATVSGHSVAVPVVIEGPFRALSGRLDANLFDKLGLLIDSWFGGDTSTACRDAGLVR